MHCPFPRHLSRWQRPDGAVLGMVGDFEAGPIMDLLRAEFGGWAPGEGQPAAAPASPREDPPAWWQQQQLEGQQQQKGEKLQEGYDGSAAASPAGRVFVVDRPGLLQVTGGRGGGGASFLVVIVWELV